MSRVWSKSLNWLLAEYVQSSPYETRLWGPLSRLDAAGQHLSTALRGLASLWTSCKKNNLFQRRDGIVTCWWFIEVSLKLRDSRGFIARNYWASVNGNGFWRIFFPLREEVEWRGSSPLWHSTTSTAAHTLLYDYSCLADCIQMGEGKPPVFHFYSPWVVVECQSIMISDYFKI